MDLKPKLKAIAAFRERGIEVKMITGDAKETAVAISAQLAMSQKRAVSGTPLFSMFQHLNLTQKIRTRNGGTERCTVDG